MPPAFKGIASTPAAAPAERTSRLIQLRPADPRPTAARITAGRPAPPARLTRRHRPQPGAARARGAPRGAPSSPLRPRPGSALPQAQPSSAAGRPFHSSLRARTPPGSGSHTERCGAASRCGGAEHGAVRSQPKRRGPALPCPLPLPAAHGTARRGPGVPRPAPPAPRRAAAKG